MVLYFLRNPPSPLASKSCDSSSCSILLYKTVLKSFPEQLVSVTSAIVARIFGVSIFVYGAD